MQSAVKGLSRPSHASTWQLRSFGALNTLPLPCRRAAASFIARSCSLFRSDDGSHTDTVANGFKGGLRQGQPQAVLAQAALLLCMATGLSSPDIAQAYNVRLEDVESPEMRSGALRPMGTGWQGPYVDRGHIQSENENMLCSVGHVPQTTTCNV